MNVVIVGLGLIGGSAALALRAADPAYAITGIDRASVLELDAARRAAPRLIEASATASVDAAFEAADLVILATPIRTIIEILPRALARAAIVTDCGSTKRSVAAAAAEQPRRGRFVPGHPMAGAPAGGIELARAELFRERRWLLCPERSDADAVGVVEAAVRRMGGEPVHLGIGEHDRAVALTSHAVQLLASALVVTAASLGAERAAGPAFAGATRSAGGPEAVWNDIFETNADETARALGLIAGELERVRSALAADVPDMEAARALLRRARETRSRSGSSER